MSCGVLIALAVMISGCAHIPENDTMEAAAKQLQEVLREIVSDSKTDLVEVSPCGQALCLTTTQQSVVALAQSDVLRLKTGREIIVRFLPEAGNLGNKRFGLVRVPVAVMQSSNRFSSEIVSEAVMGTPVLLLEKKGWYRVQTPDGYLGWIHPQQIVPMSAEQLKHWAQSDRYFVTRLQVVATDDGGKEKILLPSGSLLVAGQMQDHEPRKVLVLLPDGTDAYLDAKSVVPFNGSVMNVADEHVRQTFADNAVKLKTRPYRWAGTSVFAMDCSGLVRVAWSMAGYIGPRDADQMARMPERLPETMKSFSPGDLLFFGKNKDCPGHVAISLGGTRFIHSLGDVHEADLNPAQSGYDAWATENFLFAVRPKTGEGALNLIEKLSIYRGEI